MLHIALRCRQIQFKWTSSIERTVDCSTIERKWFLFCSSLEHLSTATFNMFNRFLWLQRDARSAFEHRWSLSSGHSPLDTVHQKTAHCSASKFNGMHLRLAHKERLLCTCKECTLRMTTTASVTLDSVQAGVQSTVSTR